MKRRLPRTSPTRWSSNSRMLQTVSMYHSDLHMVFRVIGDAEDKWDNDSVMKAAGFKRRLSKMNTCFLMLVFVLKMNTMLFDVESCWFLFYLVGNCYLLLIKNYLCLTNQKPHRTSLAFSKVMLRIDQLMQKKQLHLSH